MDPAPTSTSEEMKRSVTKVQDMEEENRNLKLKIIALTRELEKKEERENNCVCLNRQDKQVNLPRKGLRRVVSESDLMRAQEISVHAVQIEGRQGKSEENGPIMSMISEGANSTLDEIQVKEEPDDEFIPVEDHPTDTQLMDEEDTSYGPSNSISDSDPIPDSDLVDSLNVGQSSQIQLSEIKVCNNDDMSGVEGIRPPPCIVDMNPLEMEMILENILSNLGKHDLLNARMVSHAWNDQSLKVLRKSKFTQRLTEWNIRKYKFFPTPTYGCPFIMPFCLTFVLRKSSLSEYNQILRAEVKSLCQMFGPECVSTLELIVHEHDWTEENFNEIGLIECFALISPGLETLHLEYFHARNDFLKHQTIKFPKLKQLVCSKSEFEFGRTGPVLSYYSIIENSPNLEDLTLTDPCDMESWPLKFNQLKSLTLRQMFKPQHVLNQILSSAGRPVLRELNIWRGMNSGKSWSVEDKVVVHNILGSVSATLKSLTFRGYCLARMTEYTGNLRFPKLPQLEHLGLEYDIGNTSRPEAGIIDISPKNFSSLKSIELPIGFLFTSLPVQSEDNDNVRIEIPLRKLTLRVSATSVAEDVNGPLEDLQQIFPTPLNISLVNYKGHDFVNYVLYRIMNSNWSKSIQQIEMIGFGRKYLGGILDGMELNPRADLEKWYWMLEESVKIDFHNTMKKIRMEFETLGSDSPGSIILRRTNQLNCKIKK